jgi:hypothetical protein
MRAAPIIVAVIGGSTLTAEESAAAEAVGRTQANTPTIYGERAALP